MVKRDCIPFEYRNRIASSLSPPTNKKIHIKQPPFFLLCQPSGALQSQWLRTALIGAYKELAEWTTSRTTLQTLRQWSEDRLLAAIGSSTSHVLRTLFLPTIECHSSLCRRIHDFTLSQIDNKSFIPRMLCRSLNRLRGPD